MMTSLKKRILYFYFFALLIPLALSAYFDVQAIFDSYRDSLVLRLQIHAESLRFAIEKVHNLGIPIEEMEGLNARCQEIVNSDPDVAYCLVEDVNGQVLFAHDPSLPNAVNFPPRGSERVILLEGLRNWGEVYDVSVPIQNAQRDVTGWIRIGFSRGVLLSLAQDTIIRNLLILIGVFCAIYALVVAYLQRHLLSPIEGLCSVARRVSQGDFQISAPKLSTRELQNLADHLATMADSLIERDEQIAAGMEELEHSNHLLQDAYETQESISIELQRSQRLYQTLVEQASEAILVCNDADEIQMFNNQAEALFAIDADKAIHANLLQFFEEIGVADVDPLYEMYQQVLEYGLASEEFTFAGAAGEQMIGLIRAASVRGVDNEILVQMIVHDITSEHEVKQNLERSARELARLNRMKNAFLGMVSHELKTPLTIILGYADLLETQKEALGDPTLKESLGHIIDAAERLGRIIQDMVDASDFDGNRVALQRENVQLNDLLETCVDRAAESAAQRQQLISYQQCPSLPTVCADPRRLVQLFDNLVNNAIKFTPDGGRIEVRSSYLAPGSEAAQSCSCDADPQFGCVEVVVADTGIGIPVEERERIFDKFYGAGPIEEHTSSRVSFKGKGVGLGLTIVQGIVELHGGEVWVAGLNGSENTAGQGSTFHVRLPVRPASSS